MTAIVHYGGGLAITSRVIAAVFFGYAAMAGVVTLLALLLTLLAGMARVEAITVMNMLGYLIWAGFIIWAFAERRLARVWTVLLGVAILCHMASFALVPLVSIPPSTMGARAS
jgi:hypothetical protein